VPHDNVARSQHLQLLGHDWLLQVELVPTLERRAPGQLVSWTRTRFDK
jgi:hypothetical protein